MAKNGKGSPSVWNWLGTLFLYGIPGVGLIFLIFSAIFAKSTSKRRFAAAGIVLTVLLVIAVFALFAIFPDYFRGLIEKMKEMSRNIATVQSVQPGA